LWRLDSCRRYIIRCFSEVRWFGAYRSSFFSPHLCGGAFRGSIEIRVNLGCFLMACAENRASYYRARYYDSSTGRFVSEDPIDFESGQTNFYTYAGNSPVRSHDPFGLAHCIFVLNTGMANGVVICYPDNPNDDPFAFPANSGNNGDPAHKCQNNTACRPDDHGPLPVGPYRFGDPSVSHKSVGGIHLIPTGKNNQYGADGRFLTHWCIRALDSQTRPGRSGHFCSEGCIVSTPDNIKALNKLLAAEPGSTLSVIQ
jgi:RHS repeat-associated protein